ncbi:amiloride-sensitive sodium channel subunit beta-like [Ixodes scapularis]|uniref:amiloride-sensitive sodium channel subunit beta-like n=1 Tax=Ixodes scapularis TaxID=6945 RepID=UPI001C38CBA5|nr:amiloride-sensitive sodium channel subunit beta-like [Ixodes scapularis]
MIHSHGTRYSVCSDGVYITPGRATYVGLNVIAQTGLPAPYANPCRRDWPSTLLPHLTSDSISYTREECLNMCLQMNTRRECGCQSRLLPSLPKKGRWPEPTRVCKKQKELLCADRIAAEETSKFLEDQCRCYRPCFDVNYKRDVTVTDIRQQDEKDESTKQSGPLARLVVYFNTLAYEHIRSVPKYDGTRVLSNIGGINGMYLGLSFFVLFQVLDMVVMGALKLRTMWQRDYKRPRARE